MQVLTNDSLSVLSQNEKLPPFEYTLLKKYLENVHDKHIKAVPGIFAPYRTWIFACLLLEQKKILTHAVSEGRRGI